VKVATYVDNSKHEKEKDHWKARKAEIKHGIRILEKVKYIKKIPAQIQSRERNEQMKKRQIKGRRNKDRQIKREVER
jgi:hypothetical protein